MTKPNLTVDNSVVEALSKITLEAAVLRVYPPMTELEHEEKLDTISGMAEDVLPLAKRQAEAEAELIETKAALKWIVRQIFTDFDCIDFNRITLEELLTDAPAIIKRYMEEEGK